MAELVIRGGEVVDGSGAPRRRADVAIDDGRVTAVGEGLHGERELDAAGMVVAPGFIDIHTHYDAQVFWDPALTPSSWHGVTTVVAGNCGFSLAPCRPEDRDLMAHTLEHVEDMPLASLQTGIPWDFETFPEYLDAVERRGVVLNYGAYVGHTAVRMYVMGGEAAYEREATADERRDMHDVVAEALTAGALGFATSSAGTHQGDGGRPVPSRLAGIDEVASMAEALGELGLGVGAFLPGEKVTHPEIYELQRRVGRPFTWTALVTLGNGFHQRLLEIHDAGWAAGSRVYPQISVRPVVFQMTMAEPFTFQIAPIFSELLAVSTEERIARYADPAWRARAVEALDGPGAVIAPRWDAMRLFESERHAAIQGRVVSELAAERGCHPLELMLDIAIDGGLQDRFQVVLANDDTDAIAEMLPRDDLVIGLSDAGAHVGQLADGCFSTDLLGNWVRERGVLSVEHAVRKLTGEPADLFGFTDRGYLRPGMAADVVVFDPATVAPGPLRRVTDFPGGASRLVPDRPEGVAHVLVNGTAIRVDGEPVEEAVASRPGRVLRGRPA